MLIGLFGFNPHVGAMDREAERTALDALLSVLEAQTRFAVRNARYATNIEELGFQSATGSRGQLASKAAFAANWDSTNRQPAAGYYIRVLPVLGDGGRVASNSYWAVAIPREPDGPLPLYFTAACNIKNIDFPLVEWWAARVHGTNRIALGKLFTEQPGVSTASAGLDPAKPEAFPESTTVLRFLLDDHANYPEVVPAAAPPPPASVTGGQPPGSLLPLAGCAVVALLLLIMLGKLFKKK